MKVIGTAGHVDHGKTLLIEALTGTNPDTLPEEKRRGLTIDLGFAHFDDSAGQPVGVIDVPGHERFIRNMAAGAWSLDLALLCVAADDGWMQQSEDHTRVLRIMDVPQLLVVVTKTDLVTPERVTRVRDQAVERCRILGYAQAPAMAVSAHAGRNIDALRALILRLLGAAPRRPPAPAYLHVDRSFTLRGTGAVVTGTLRGGELARGQELILLPSRKKVRVRVLQSYHREQERVQPGSRVAINLSGVQREELGRGQCLTVPGSPFHTERRFIARIFPPPGNPEPSGRSPEALRAGREVEIALGTGHWIARLRSHGRGATAEVETAAPLPLLWNQPFVMIRRGGAAILGGGRVLWPGPLDREGRRRLAALEKSLPARLERRHWAEVMLAVEGVIPPAEARRIGSLAGRAHTVQLDGWVLSRSHLAALQERVRALAAEPGGVRLAELPGRLSAGNAGAPPAGAASGGAPPELLRIVARDLVEAKVLSARDGTLLPAERPAAAISPMGRRLHEELQAAGRAGLELRKLKVAGARKELRALARTGLAVSLDGQIFYAPETYAELLDKLFADCQVGQRLSIAEAKNRTALSRKYIIPLLNRLEHDGYLERSGDERIVTRLPRSAGKGK